MPQCPSCGEEVRTGDWTCGKCGEVLPKGLDQGAMTDYGSTMPTVTLTDPSRAGKSGKPMSPALKIVLIGGGIAVLAIVLIWFFFLRGGGGDPSKFLGAWSPTTVSTVPFDEFRIEQSGGKVSVTVVQKGQEIGPFKASVHGDRLETKLESASGDKTKKAIADAYRGILGSLFENFKFVFTIQPSGNLVFSVDGKAKVTAQDLKDASGNSVELTKAL